MKKTIILFIFLLLSSTANANEKYEYCEIWGIAGGVNDSFIQNLVGRVLDKKKLLLDSACASVKRDSYQFGARYGQGQHISYSDAARWMKYQNYRDKVMDSILNLIDH